MRRSKPGPVAAILAACCAASGCATVSNGDREPIAYSADWFRCSSQFQCAVVYDAWCRNTAVNRRFALVYQDWALEQVELAGERRPCPDPDMFNPVAACYEQRCTYPIPLRRPEEGDDR